MLSKFLVLTVERSTKMFGLPLTADGIVVIAALSAILVNSLEC